jgi:hypothetical protein
VIRNDSRGLQIAGYTTVNNMKVYNNVFAWNGVDGVTVWMDMSGVDIKNNMCYQNGRYGIQFSAATGSGVAMDHNLVYANVSGNYYFDTGSSTVSYTLGTTLSSDPKFVNATSANFDAHLQSASPAIGAGLNFSSVFTTDMESAARPVSGAWDLGAYVHAASVALPTVTVAASVPAASRVGLANGAFVVSRTGDSSSALTVNLALSGTATNGVDYTSLGTTMTIPAGAASATLVVAPLPSASVVGSRTVVLTLSSNSLYSVGSSAKSTVTIAGNSLPSVIHPTSGNSIQLSWNSATGKIYRVAYKNALTDSAWTDLGGAITATGASTSYSDANVRVRAQRFYVVRVTT